MSKKRLIRVVGILSIVTIVSVFFAYKTAIAEDAKPAAAGDYKLPANFKLVCIGDSITQGRKGGGDAKPTYSWRYPLWKMFVDADIQVDFVGSLNGGFNGDPDWADYKGKKFPRNHEGHWGWTTMKISEELPGWISKYTPDAAMILLGTNDKATKSNMEPTVKAYKSIIETLRKKNPKVLVIIGPPYVWPAELSKVLGEMANELSTKQSPVVVIDLAKGWEWDPKKEGTCTVDGCHPNEKGDAMLAQKWFEGIKPFIGK